MSKIVENKKVVEKFVDVVMFKNNATVKVGNEIVTARLSDLKDAAGIKAGVKLLGLEGKLNMRVNTQGLGQKNRDIVNGLIGKDADIKYNSVYPTDAAVNYESVMAGIGNKPVVVEIASDDMKALKALTEKYNKASLVKFIKGI